MRGGGVLRVWFSTKTRPESINPSDLGAGNTVTALNPPPNPSISMGCPTSTKQPHCPSLFGALSGFFHPKTTPKPSPKPPGTPQQHTPPLFLSLWGVFPISPPSGAPLCIPLLFSSAGRTTPRRHRCHPGVTVSAGATATPSRGPPVAWDHCCWIGDAHGER